MERLCCFTLVLLKKGTLKESSRDRFFLLAAEEVREFHFSQARSPHNLQIDSVPSYVYAHPFLRNVVILLYSMFG